MEYSFAYDPICSIIGALAHRQSYDRLTVLILAVEIFTPQILDILADSLPSLKKLYITAIVIDQDSFHENTRIYWDWKELTSLWIGHFELAAWWLMLYLADYCIPTIPEYDGHPVWTNRCECAIITIDSLRDEFVKK